MIKDLKINIYIDQCIPTHGLYPEMEKPRKVLVVFLKIITTNCLSSTLHNGMTWRIEWMDIALLTLFMLTWVVGPFLELSVRTVIVVVDVGCYVGWKTDCIQDNLFYTMVKHPISFKRKGKHFEKKISVNISFFVIILLR